MRWDRMLRAGAAAWLVCAAGCGGGSSPRAGARPEPRAAVHALADSGVSTTLAVRPPVTAVRLAEAMPAPGEAPAPPLPQAAPDTVFPAGEHAAARSTDETLHPPILREAGRLVAPPGLRAAAYVELELRIDERGRVSDAEWADGTRDTALVRAARECAATMVFYPALLHGEAVAVWCRQRFDLTPR